jgi:hypothetical protein
MFLDYEFSWVKSFDTTTTPYTVSSIVKDVIDADHIAPEGFSVKKTENQIQRDTFKKKKADLYRDDATSEGTFNLAPGSYDVLDKFSFGQRSTDANGVTTDGILRHESLKDLTLPWLMTPKLPNLKYRLYLKGLPKTGVNDLNVSANEYFKTSITMDFFDVKDTDGKDITYIEADTLEKVLTKFKAVIDANPNEKFFGNEPVA